MCEHIEIFARLAARFQADEVKERSQGNRKFHYVTARTVMNRLDQVLGPSNWWDEYTVLEGASAVVCKLTIRLPGGEELTKSDAGGMSNTNDPSDSEKSGFSDAFKRAAVKFGVARYLYGDGVPRVIAAELDAMQERRRQEREAREEAAREREAIQAEARVVDEPRPPAALPPPAAPSAPAKGPRRSDTIPRTGRALFAWAKDNGALAYLENLGREWQLPPRLVDWSDSDAVEAYNACIAKNGVPARQRTSSPRRE